MAKWAGTIGFRTEFETSPGVWVNKITERKYYGDVVKNHRRLESTDTKVNPDINVSNQLNVVADPYAKENFWAIVYAEFMGVKWMVTSIEVNYPRLSLTLGGLYNGEQN